MGVKYVKDFSFPSSGGFHGDVQRYAKGGHVTKMPAKAKASAKGVPARAKPNAPAKGAPKMESKPAKGKRQGYNEGGRVPGYEMDRLPTKRPPGRGMDLAPARRFKGKYEGYAEGGPVDEILPGDGRGGLEMAMPTKQVGRYSDEYDLPPLLPEDYEMFPRPELQQTPLKSLPETPNLTTMPRNPRYDVLPLPPEEPPVGILKPLPVEPIYNPKMIGPGGQLISEERPTTPPQIDYSDMPMGVMGGGDEYWRKGGIKDQQAERTRQWYISKGLTPPGEVAPRTRADMIADRRDIVGSRGEMARPRGLGRAVMRARDKIAARAATPRMGIPKLLPPIEMPEEAPDRTIRYYKKGGEVKGKKIAKVMREYKEGKLHSGSKKGPVVKSEKQAMAIALSEARKAGAKIPKKAEGGIFNDESMAYESKGPKTRGTARKGRIEGRRERRAREAMERAEKYAPGLSLDMADRKNRGGMPVHRRKPMYGGGKC